MDNHEPAPLSSWSLRERQGHSKTPAGIGPIRPNISAILCARPKHSKSTSFWIARVTSVDLVDSFQFRETLKHEQARRHLYPSLDERPDGREPASGITGCGRPARLDRC